MTRIAIDRRTLFGLGALAIAGRPLAAGAIDVAAAIVPIQRLTDALLAIMRAGRATPFEQRFAQLAPVIDNAFDLDTFLQNSVGPTWQTLPPDQKSQLQAAFRRYTIARYVNSFDSYDGQRFTISPTTRALANGQQIVETRIVPRSGTSHVLAYVMRPDGQRWRAVDVLADSISQVAVQRSDFRALLSRGGAPALVASLQSKTTNLWRGAG